MTKVHGFATLFFACCACVAWIYSPVNQLGYVWDDLALFVDSPALRTREGIVAALFQPILPGTTYLRPLVLSTFYLEFIQNGPTPQLSHWVNVAFFLLNVGLVGLLVRLSLRVLASPHVSAVTLMAMLMYGLHPAMVESVAWVAGRFDLMVTTFCLIGLLLAFSVRPYPRAVGVGASFFLALLCKEMAIVFPLLYFSLLWVCVYQHMRFWPFVQQCLRERWPDLGAMVIVLIGYLMLRHLFMPTLLHADGAVSALAWHDRVAMVGHAVFFYLRMLVWPFDILNPLHPVDLDFSTIRLILGVLVLSVLTIAFVVQLVRSWNPLGILFWMVIFALLPVLHIIPLTIGGNIGHERFLALPAAIFVVLLAVGVSRLLRFARPGMVAAVAMFYLVLSAFNVRVTVPLWKSDVSLWAWALEKNPDFPYAQASLVGAAVRSGYHEYATKVMAEIRARDPHVHPQVRIAESLLLVRTGRPQESLQAVNEGLATMFKPHELLVDQGINLELAHIHKTSMASIWALRGAYAARAEAYIAQYRFADALDAMTVALFYQPDYPPALLLKSLALYGLDRSEEAKVFFDRSVLLIVNDAKNEPYDIRRQFIAKLCEADAYQPFMVCREKVRLVSERWSP